MKAPELEFVCTLKVDLDPAMEMGAGGRVIVASSRLSGVRWLATFCAGRS